METATALFDACVAAVRPAWAPILLGPAARPLLWAACYRVAEDLVIHGGGLAPAAADVMAAWRHFDPADLRAVVLGQDPYPTAGHADGLCFSTRAAAAPPSLRNIHQALRHAGLLADDRAATNTLTGWAEQGVLLMNAGLTTRAGVSDVHLGHWQPYIVEVIAQLLELDQTVAWLCWGGKATGLMTAVARATRGRPHNAAARAKHHVLTWRHPSPLGNAGAAPAEHFHQCTNFATANAVLALGGRPPIDWGRLGAPGDAGRAVADVADATQALAALTLGAPPAVLAFTDGSASANGAATCRAGWGVYVPAAPFECALAGVAGPFGHTEEVRLCGPVPAGAVAPSNNRGELLAIMKALEWMLGLCQARPDDHPRRLVVVSDSQYSVNTLIEWAPRWVAKGALAKQKNPDMIGPALAQLAALRAAGVDVRLVHVRGHGRDARMHPGAVAGNEAADRLAADGQRLIE